MICPHCSQEQEEGLSQCKMCGTDLKPPAISDKLIEQDVEISKKWTRWSILIIYLPAIMVSLFLGILGPIRGLYDGYRIANMLTAQGAGMLKSWKDAFFYTWPALVLGALFLGFFYFFQKRFFGIFKRKEEPLKKSIFVLGLFYVLFFAALFAIRYEINRIKQQSTQQFPQSSKVNLEAGDYNWPLHALDGRETNLSDFKKKVVFLNIWATWCPPCKGEMPSIQKLYDKCKADPGLKDVEFLLVSDEDLSTVKTFIEKNNYTFPVYVAKSNSPDVFRTQGIPTTFFISRGGKIALKEVGAADWSNESYLSSLKLLALEKETGK